MTYHDGPTAWTGYAEPTHFGYGANGYPIHCTCGLVFHTGPEFREHIESLPPP